MDDEKKPLAKKPGEKKPGKFHYNPVNMSGKEAVLQENDETAAENTAEQDDDRRQKDGSRKQRER